MRSLAASVLVMITACGAAPDEGKDCDLSAVLSLALDVTDETGQRIVNASGRWTAGARSDDCQRSGATLQCGWEVAGAMSVVVSAPGFTPKTVAATILQGECHVVPQQQTVALERKRWFDEERRYVHTFFATQAECTEAQTGGRGIICCAQARFGADGRADIVTSDIMNSGTYRIESGALVFTREGLGDVPETVRFASGVDDVFTDDARGWTWTRSISGGCF